MVVLPVAETFPLQGEHPKTSVCDPESEVGASWLCDFDQVWSRGVRRGKRKMASGQLLEEQGQEQEQEEVHLRLQLANTEIPK